MKIFDTHSHYADHAFDEDREQVLAELPHKGVELVMLAASDMRDCAANSELAKKYDYVYAAAGIHPESLDETHEDYLDFLRDILKDQSYVALAYMTGILPIKKYGIHSALNMFTENRLFV